MAAQRAFLLERLQPNTLPKHMPARIPPSLSRREFLRRGLAAAASLLAAPASQAAGRPGDPHSWALLADLHIAADKTAAQRGIVMADQLKQVVAELVALPRRPAGAILAGDLALNSGQAGDYATLRTLLEPLRATGLPVHMAPGNHDDRQRLLEAFPDMAREARPVPGRCVAVIRSARVNWFLLDSLDRTLSTPGRLGAEQLAWLARALDAHANKPALVVLHHNLDDRNGAFQLQDSPELFALLRARPQVKAGIFGHSHIWGVWEDSSGIQCINLPPVAYVFRKGDPAGWVHATLERQGMTLELRCIDHTHPAHGQVVRVPWRRR